MRKTLVIIMVLGCQISFAQTYEEWMRQKRTQIKYLEQQIVANRVYIDVLEKGYGIARDGLHTIQHIRQGDFAMHFNFFDSLRKVNPRIRNYTKVAQIIAFQLFIIEKSGETLKNIRETGQFAMHELDYCKKVFANLLDECLKDIDEVILVITDGRITMTDDERIKRIDRQYSDMQDKYSFTISFSNEMGILSVQRLMEQTDINYSKKIYGF